MEQYTQPYILPFRVHVPRLLTETFTCAIPPEIMESLRIPMNQFLEYIRLTTMRCSEINDPVLNKLMIDMTLYEESDLYSKEYDQEMVDQVNENYKNYINKEQKDGK